MEDDIAEKKRRVPAIERKPDPPEQSEDEMLAGVHVKDPTNVAPTGCGGNVETKEAVESSLAS